VSMADFPSRARFAALGALAVAVVSPVMSYLPWEGAPTLLRDYLVPDMSGLHGRFPFFPCASYVAFGLAIGAVVKRTAEERMERLMQWTVLIGFGMIFVSQYLSNIPYSIYMKSDFWMNSPTLILIRVGVS